MKYIAVILFLSNNYVINLVQVSLKIIVPVAKFNFFEEVFCVRVHACKYACFPMIVSPYALLNMYSKTSCMAIALDGHLPGQATLCNSLDMM